MKNLFKTGNLLLVFSILIGCSKDKEELKERPDNIIASKPCPTLYTSIMDKFSEFDNAQEENKVFFTDGVAKEILVTQETEIYVSYISEGAGFNNVFGYYSYNQNAPPTGPSNIELKVVFPNVSEKVLAQGDMVKISDSKFAAGTVVGFFLIVDGWENRAINYEKQVVFTNPSYNTNNAQQHVLFREGTCDDIVLAFEDVPLDQPGDKDFNDLIFTISDNSEQKEVTSFDLSAVAEINN